MLFDERCRESARGTSFPRPSLKKFSHPIIRGIYSDIL
jgi:hypothetical protein